MKERIFNIHGHEFNLITIEWQNADGGTDKSLMLCHKELSDDGVSTWMVKKIRPYDKSGISGLCHHLKLWRDYRILPSDD